jgi:hypothetical protein
MAALMQIAAVATAPDASRAVTVAANGRVRIWGIGVSSRVIRWAVPIHDGDPVAVAVSENRIRVLRVDGTAIWRHENVEGAVQRDGYFMAVAPAPVQALALSPSGALAAAAYCDGTVQILNADTGEVVTPLATGGLIAHAVALASDRGPVVAAFADGHVRRYHLAMGRSDIAGSHPGIRFLAISSDGEAVIAVAGRIMIRWDLSGAAPTDYRMLEADVTAIAVEGTGGKVLAGRADGTLWRYDMTGGSAVELTATPPAPSPPAAGWWEDRGIPDHGSPALPPAPSPPAADWWEDRGIPDHGSPAPPPAPTPTPPWISAGTGMIDDDVRFTVYRPQTLSPGVWASLMVFAHKTDLIEEPGKPPLDPNKEVQAIARAHFGNIPVRDSGEDARSPVFRGARLRITVDLPRIECNPAEAGFDWWEPVHHVVFRLLAPPDLVGSVVRGAVRVWCGPLILGEVSLAIRVTASAPAVPPPAVPESVARYRKIFPSYSLRDRAIVDAFAEVVRTFGDEYLRDVVAIRTGEMWRDRLRELIEEADVFQLFWSSNSMRSPWCQKEWEHALALGRPLFVRPFYWEDPRPADPANGLPPAALDTVQFVKISLFAAQKEIPVYPGPDTGVTAGVGPAEPGYAPREPGYAPPEPAYAPPEPGYAPPAPGAAAAGYPAGSDTGEGPRSSSAPPQPYGLAGAAAPAGGFQRPAGRVRRAPARRRGRRLVVALVLAVIVVAVIIAIGLGGR